MRPTESVFDLVQLKAEMLCLGVVAPNGSLEPARTLNPESFIHGTVFRLASGGIVNTNVWTETDLLNLPDVKPPFLERDHEGGLIVHGTKISSALELLTLGSEAGLSLEGRIIGDWFSLHSPTTLFCAPVRQCAFISAGKPCLFCTFEGGKIRPLAPAAFETALNEILRVHPEISSVAIGGGTPRMSDMGVSYYAQIASVLSHYDLACSVELVPPRDLVGLFELQRAGVSSVIMSLEVWNEENRLKWCLGKGIVSRTHYFNAWSQAIKLFGPGNVASVLLVGTESIDDTYRGATALIEEGVIPTLIPLRWYADSRFSEWRPVSPDVYIELEQKVAELLRAAGLSANRQRGCTACGGCSLETAMEPGALPQLHQLTRRFK